MLPKLLIFCLFVVLAGCSDGGGQHGTSNAGASSSGGCLADCIAATGNLPGCRAACGVDGVGGDVGTGGAVATGGTSNAAGAPGTGGVPATGGAVGVGGAPGSGGAAGVGGAGGGGPTPLGAPGTSCSCDSECAGDTAHPGVCVFGICMTRATGACSSGSSAECTAGSRCWELRDNPGAHLCWPDCAAVSCDGICDSDGSCTYPSDGTCDPACGSHCPPDAAPCSPSNPTGFCGDPNEQCIDGGCVLPCSATHPTGACPPGRNCEAGVCISAGGCPDWECTGTSCDEIILMPGSTDPNSAQALADGYYLAHRVKYSYLRRDLTMLTQYAACEVANRYPGTTPLGLGDLAQADGRTPGVDVGNPRHLTSTHRGNDLDIAYYQTDGLNDTQIICGDGSDNNGNSCCGNFNDGRFCTTEQNIVDWPRQAFFFAKMAVKPEARIFGIDQTLADDFTFHLDQLLVQGDITQAERSNIRLGYGAAGSWQFHHHHVHLSYCRIGFTGSGCPRPMVLGPQGEKVILFAPPWTEATRGPLSSGSLDELLLGPAHHELATHFAPPASTAKGFPMR